jgi:hypothetical protein
MKWRRGLGRGGAHPHNNDFQIFLGWLLSLTLPSLVPRKEREGGGSPGAGVAIHPGGGAAAPPYLVKSGALCPHSAVLCLHKSVLWTRSAVLCPQSALLCPRKSISCPQSALLCPHKRVLCPQSALPCPPQKAFSPPERGAWSRGAGWVRCFLSERTHNKRQWGQCFPEFWTVRGRARLFLCGAGVGKPNAFGKVPFESYATMSRLT